MSRITLFFALFLISASVAYAQQFSGVVSVDGDHVVVGDGNSPAVPGVVYFFQLNDAGTWSEMARVTASDSEGAVDAFGRSLSISGNTMVVGAPRVGKAYIFDREAGGAWQESQILASDLVDFGAAVAASANTILVASPSSTESGGHVSMYRRHEGGEWQQEGMLSAGGAEKGDGYGSVLAMAGDVALVAAPGAVNGAGVVHVFDVSSSSDAPSYKGPISPGMSADGNGFGSSLLFGAGRLFVGAPGFENGIGSVFAYSINAESGDLETSTQISPYVAERGARFGSALAVAGHHLWVGAPGFGGRRGAGAVYNFDMDHGSMAIVSSNLTETPDLQERSQYGASLAANHQVAVVGAPGFDNRAGVAFPFSHINHGWDVGNALVNDIFGYESMAGELIRCEEDAAGDFPCKDVDLMSFVSMKDLGADRGIRTNDLWGWEDTETGREYAIVGLSNQTSFVDVSDPYNPIFLGELDMPETANMSVWRDMKVYKNHAYIVSDGAGEHGIQIFDLTQLRDIPNPPVVFEETAHYPGIFSAHNIVINEDTGFAYSVGSSAGGTTCGGGLHMIDLSDPPNPRFAGCFSDGTSGRRGTGYSHDAQCVIYHGPDADYQGKEICIGANETAISIADVTDKENPVGVALADYPGVSYAHQGWLTDDHRYFYLNDELDEARNLVEGTRTLIWDFTDLDEPMLSGEFIAETTETDHNLYVKGNLMYQSNTGAGLRILDITNPEEPFETAYFDTSPVGGRGVSWSNYPYFKSGIIVVTGGHYGLFILQKKEVDI